MVEKMPFSEKTQNFLFENAMHDSKAWYNEHKDDYIKYVAEPFAEFVKALTPTMLEIDPRILCNPKKTSRLYRDSRFSQGKSIFRDDVWYSFRRHREPFEAIPEFFFDVSANSFCYGCGYYAISKPTLEVVREMILADDAFFKKALKAYENQDTFTLEGDLYKRNHYPEQSERLCNWLNRKSLYFFCGNKPNSEYFRADMAERIAADFKQISPVYLFFCEAERRAALRHSE